MILSALLCGLHLTACGSLTGNPEPIVVTRVEVLAPPPALLRVPPRPEVP